MTNRKIPSDFDEGKFTISVHRRYRPQITEIRLRELEHGNLSEYVCEAILFYEKYKNATEKQWQLLMGNSDIEKMQQVLQKWMMKGQPPLFPWVIGNHPVENETPVGYQTYPTGTKNDTSSASIQAEENNELIDSKESVHYQQDNMEDEEPSKENIPKENVSPKEVQGTPNYDSNKENNAVPTEPIIKVNNKVVPHQEWKTKSNNQTENHHSTPSSPNKEKNTSSSTDDSLARYLFDA